MKKTGQYSFVVLFAALSTVTLLLGRARAEPSPVDPTWGEEGVAVANFATGDPTLDDQTNALFLQPDGKVLVAGWADIWPGDFGTARFLPDGSLDPSFGSGGMVTTAFSNNPDNVDAAWSITQRPDGGVYVAGESCDEDYIVCDWALAALKPDGAPDNSFGTKGLVTTAAGTDTVYAWPRRNILQADGKLVIGGVTFNEGEDTDIGLRRHNPDGSLDTSFGTNGIVIQDLEKTGNYVQDILPYPGQKILVVGGFGTIEDDPFFYDDDLGFMALFDKEGALDKSFGGGEGYVTWNYMDMPVVSKGGLLGSNDAIYVVGEYEDACTLQRFNMLGELDINFGDAGWVFINSADQLDCWDIRETPDGKLAFDGGSFPQFETQPASARANRTGRNPVSRNMMQQVEVPEILIGRYNLDGTPDKTFGDNGLARFLVNEEGSGGFGLEVQPDGKLLTTADVYNLEDENLDMGVVRFINQNNIQLFQLYAPAVMSP